jgi:hypothetical protein
MSVPSEQPREQAPSTNPQDPLHYAPRRFSERTESRLAAVVGDIQATDRASRPDPAVRSIAPSTALNAKLENAVYESLLRQIDPQVVPEPADFKRERSQRALIGVVIGVAAAIVVSAAVALAYVTMFPGAKDKVPGASLATTAAQPRQTEDRSKPVPALAQFRGLLVAGESGQAFTHEQSEQLLQQFMQWRQKADSPEKP